MSQTGSESVPVKGEPRSDVETLTFENVLLSVFLNSGEPQSAQQRGFPGPFEDGEGQRVGQPGQRDHDGGG